MIPRLIKVTVFERFFSLFSWVCLYTLDGYLPQYSHGVFG